MMKWPKWMSCLSSITILKALIQKKLPVVREQIKELAIKMNLHNDVNVTEDDMEAGYG